MKLLLFAGAIAIALALPMADMDVRIRRYNSWIHSLSDSHQNFEVFHAAPFGLGVRARGPVAVGDVMTNVSINDCYHIFNVLSDPFVAGNRTMRDLYSDLSETDALALFMLQNVGDLNSRWSPWLQLLSLFPDNHTHRVTFWPPAAVAAIEPASLRMFVLELNATTTREYSAFSSIIRRHPHAVSSQELAPTGRLSYASWLSARTVIESRYWSRHGHKVLVAGADFFNHKVSPVEALWTPDTYVDNQPLNNAWFGVPPDLSEGHAVLFADRTAAQSEHVFESYKASSGPHFFLAHTFIPPPPDPQWCYELSIHAYVPSTAYLKPRADTPRGVSTARMEPASSPPSRSSHAATAATRYPAVASALAAMDAAYRALRDTAAFRRDGHACIYEGDVCPYAMLHLTLKSVSDAATSLVASEGTGPQADADTGSGAGAVMAALYAATFAMSTTAQSTLPRWRGVRADWRALWRRMAADPALTWHLRVAYAAYARALDAHLADAFTTTLASDMSVLRERMAAAAAVVADGDGAAAGTAAVPVTTVADWTFTDVPPAEATAANAPTFALAFRCILKDRIDGSAAEARYRLQVLEDAADAAAADVAPEAEPAEATEISPRAVSAAVGADFAADVEFVGSDFAGAVATDVAHPHLPRAHVAVEDTATAADVQPLILWDIIPTSPDAAGAARGAAAGAAEAPSGPFGVGAMDPYTYMRAVGSLGDGGAYGSLEGTSARDVSWPVEDPSRMDTAVSTVSATARDSHTAEPYDPFGSIFSAVGAVDPYLYAAAAADGVGDAAFWHVGGYDRVPPSWRIDVHALWSARELAAQMRERLLRHSWPSPCPRDAYSDERCVTAECCAAIGVCGPHITFDDDDPDVNPLGDPRPGAFALLKSLA